MGRMGLQENQDDPGGLASKGSEENQEPLASGQASEALKETRESLGPLGNRATWATQGPTVPQGNKVPQDQGA